MMGKRMFIYKGKSPFPGLFNIVWLVCISLYKQVQHFHNPIYPSEFSAVVNSTASVAFQTQ